ncbi:hypothetical protein J1N35_036250 [Gossypium stocksii]|uniref:Uncharacterized protein n=1 Tax=Gossypium stocksii TaxID=47602 RepID=A0A9D3ZJT1_9ROSI|nr:hypothetical protein J1N35_036250 [Gossypium stocksii]
MLDNLGRRRLQFYSLREEPLMISMHDILEELGKDIVRQDAIGIGNCSRLWSPKDVYQVLRYNKCKNSGGNEIKYCSDTVT